MRFEHAVTNQNAHVVPNCQSMLIVVCSLFFVPFALLWAEALRTIFTPGIS